MPRPCGICRNPKRDEIDAALVGGETSRNVALRFGTTSSATFRHAKAHLPAALIKSRSVHEISRADNLVAQVEELKRKADQILQKAEMRGDLRTALSGIRELARLIELLGKLTGELKAVQVNILNVESFDSKTAREIAEIYLQRHPKELS